MFDTSPYISSCSFTFHHTKTENKIQSYIIPSLGNKCNEENNLVNDPHNVAKSLSITYNNITTKLKLIRHMCDCNSVK